MQELAIFLAIISAPVALGLYFWLQPKWVRRRRTALRSEPLPPGYADVLSRNVALYSALSKDLREQLHGHINVFLAEKRFFGVGGQEITPDVAITVAGNACLLLLNRDATYFPGFKSILVYPNTYEVDHVDYDGGVATQKRSRRAGESWHRGPIVLAWSSVVHGAAIAGDGYNVVLHEFAHKLDEENMGTNGQPILREAGHYQEWAEVLGREYKSFADRVASRKNKVMDEYGLTSPAEFFAVATESFFEKSRAMKKRLPDLYDQLVRFYAVDPASWK